MRYFEYEIKKEYVQRIVAEILTKNIN